MWERLFMEIKGVGFHMAAGETGSRRNAAAVENFVCGITSRERLRRFRNPRKAFCQFSERTAGLISILGEKARVAKEMLERTALVLGVPAASLPMTENVLCAHVLISLHDSLQALYLRAKDAGDCDAATHIYSMRRIGIAADKLAVRSDELLHAGSQMSAREAHECVMTSLDGADAELGVQFASFPLDQ